LLTISESPFDNNREKRLLKKRSFNDTFRYDLAGDFIARGYVLTRSRAVPSG
jgi:hypothetical protein